MTEQSKVAPVEAQAVADLHQQIMNLPCRPTQPQLKQADNYEVGYKFGHRDARHAAAQLVAASPAAAAGRQEDTMGVIGPDGRKHHLFRTRAEEDAAVARSPLKVAADLLSLSEYVLVPRDPTPAMVGAGANAAYGCGGEDGNITDAWDAMVAASPAAADLPIDMRRIECLLKDFTEKANLAYSMITERRHAVANEARATLLSAIRDAVAASPAAAAGVPTQQKENSNEGSTAQAPALGVDVAGSVRAEQGDGQMESQAHAAEGAKAVARLNWLHSSGSHNVDGWEWGIYRVRWIAGNTAEVLQTGSDFSDLDLAMGASPVAPVGAPTEERSANLADLDAVIERWQGLHDTVESFSDDPDKDRSEFAVTLKHLRAFRVLLSAQGCELATDATKQTQSHTPKAPQ